MQERDASISALAAAVSFAVNETPTLIITKLPPEKVGPVICDLLSSGAEIDSLSFKEFHFVELTEIFSQSYPIHALTAKLRRSGGHYPGLNSNGVTSALISTMNPELEELSISDIIFSSGECKMLQVALRRCTSLHSITFNKCCFNGGDVAAGLVGARALNKVSYVGNSELSPEAADALMRALAGLPSLKDLDLSEQSIKSSPTVQLPPALDGLREDYARQLCDDGICAFIGDAFPACNIQRLRLNRNEMQQAAGCSLARMVAHAPHLKTLDISDNFIKVVAANAIGEAIRRTGTVSELNAYYCKLSPEGLAGFLCGGAHGNCPFIVLKLSFNFRIGYHEYKSAEEVGRDIPFVEDRFRDTTPDGVVTLAKALKSATALRELDLSKNGIGPESAKVLLESLVEGSNPLYELNLSLCLIKNAGAEVVGRIIMTRGCERVWLNDNGIGKLGIKVVVDACAEPRSGVKMLQLDSNHAGIEAVRWIAQKLIRDERLVIEELHIENIDMGDEGAKVVAHALDERNGKGALHLLSVTNDDCTEEGLSVLNDAKKRWDALKVHDINHYDEFSPLYMLGY